MRDTPAKPLEDDDLHRFHGDFRRALLMHRRSRLNLHFRLHFPTQDDAPFGDVDPAAGLDLRPWFTEAPSEAVSSHPVFRELVGAQDELISQAREALQAAALRQLQVEQLSRLLRTMHEFDRVADRLDATITTSLTDIDELTGLLNRSAMERDLERELTHARRTGARFTVAMVDADHFKAVNDSHGHGFGDHVLETLAERFVQSLRPRDRVYRYGGEEFLVMLPNTPLAKARAVLERLRQRAVAREIRQGEMAVTQSVSVGAAETADDETPAATVARADEALYRAKAAGRNRVVLDGLPDPVDGTAD